MKKRRWPFCLVVLCLLLLLVGGTLAVRYIDSRWEQEEDSPLAKTSEVLRRLLGMEPKEVERLRQQEVAVVDEGRQEYYFGLLREDEKRVYREMLGGIRERREEFYLTTADGEAVDRIYHALLKDHPELYWVHNRRQIYRTTFSGGDYCLFAPGYAYTEEERGEIDGAMEGACAQVAALIPQGADDYEKVQVAYTYLIDHTEYQPSEHDQSIAGVFWKKQAVCAGYAGALQYLLEYLGVPCIYVDGSAKDSDEGHAWNIVTLGGQYYYVDATNGDQPDFLEGEAALLKEHKTTIYDYLCPFPWEYEMTYTPSEEFALPECTATEMNFYVRNQGCFDTYDPDSLYEYCTMRLDNGAAVVRFKFSSQEAFDLARQDWVAGGRVQQVARYYMSLHGLAQVEYHYGILENLKTIYYMF
ncbi:MAG: transglutaminase domain-containing protein [Eubacteriales bacterium]|nr:transglutaminase domain-containing protein [Eubacteriales bacterium]